MSSQVDRIIVQKEEGGRNFVKGEGSRSKSKKRGW